MSRRRATADAHSYGLGLGLPSAPAPQPAPATKPRPRPAPARIASVPAAAPVVALPSTPWCRVASECPDHRGVDAHELAVDHWTCSCGWTGTALAGHRCAGVALLQRRAWVHIERTSGGPVRCVPGAVERVYRWDTLEWTRAGLTRVSHTKPRAPRYVPVGGLAYVDRLSSAYSAAESAGRRPCANAPTVAERRACGCSPAGLCVVARALVEQIEERRRLRAAGAEVPRAMRRPALVTTETVLRAHLAGVALTCVRGMWRAQAIRG